jgi:hypothetical protein
MPNIVCIVCQRDFYSLQRQLKSLSNFVSPDYKIIYVIEDIGVSGEIFYDFLTNYINQKYSLLNIEIHLSKKWLSNKFRNHPGWIRQQLLKLLVCADQTDTCHVIDSKNFLINPLPLIMDSGYQLIIDNYVQHITDDHQLLVYIDIEKQHGLTTSSNPATPFVIEPYVVQLGMKNWPRGNFLEWWYTYHLENPSVYTSEFLLYHVWYQKYVSRTPPLYKHTALTIWPKAYHRAQFWDKTLFPEIHNYTDIFDLLEKCRQHGVCWAGLHRTASQEFSEDEKTKWLHWIKGIGHTEEYNEKEFSEDPYYINVKINKSLGD